MNLRFARAGRLSLLLALLIAVVLSGCATTYKPIRPESLQYTGEQTTGPLTFAYRYDVLAGAGNGRYAKKAERRGISAVAVRVTNTGDVPAELSRSTLDVATGQRRLGLIDPGTVAGLTRQAVFPHLLWGLLTLTIQSDDDLTIIPIGVPIALGNMIVAGSANSRAQKEFSEQHVLDRTLAPGEVAHGLLFLQDAAYGPLSFTYTGPGSEPAVPHVVGD